MGRPSPQRGMHVGSSWEDRPSVVETQCPCTKGPCGLVEEPSLDCYHHSPFTDQPATIRQFHWADRCPNLPGGPVVHFHLI